MNLPDRVASSATRSALSGKTPAGRKTVLVPARSFGARRLKRCAQLLFSVRVVPRRIALAVMRKIVGEEAFRHAGESIAAVAGIHGVYQRQSFYKSQLEACGEDVHFGWLSVISMAEAEVGDRVYIGRGCSIGFARIGDEVMLADGVQILSGGKEHSSGSHDESMQGQGQQFERVCIGRGAWIGAGAIVMADVGAGAVIGAGAVVTRAIPDDSVAVGVPARLVRDFNGLESAGECNT